MTNTNNQKIKNLVRTAYNQIAKKESSGCVCNCNDNKEISASIGYSESEMNLVPDANLGLGCGNPTALGTIKKGDTVLDLGSGAGFDAFLVAKKVGDSGKVIGIDMTESMIEKATALAKKHNFTNVEFRLGDIEKLPVDDNSVNIIISNCVINLAPDKLKVFKESKRVLKSEGKMYVSDIVLLKELSEEQRNNKELIAGCVGGALLKEEYLKIVKNAGLNYKILSEDTEISKRQYSGIALESLKLEIFKE